MIKFHQQFHKNNLWSYEKNFSSRSLANQVVFYLTTIVQFCIFRPKHFLVFCKEIAFYVFFLPNEIIFSCINVSTNYNISCRFKKSVIHNQMFRSSEATTRVFYKKAVRTCNFIKKDSNTGFYCEYCELFKNTYFQEHLRTAASANWRARVLSRVNSWKVISSYCFWATIWKFTHDFLTVCLTSFLFVAWY